MKNHLVLFSLIIAVLTGCGNSAEKTADGTVGPTPELNVVNAPPAEEMPSSATDSATSVKNRTPGDKHKELAASEGHWVTENTYWQSEGATPTTAKGTCDIKMVLGGRYQQSIFKTENGGEPYEGIGYVAYDNAKKVYVNTWIDNAGTGILYLEGGYDINTKTTEMDGKCVDPYTCRQRGMRQVTRNVDKNTQILEMYQTPDGGKEFKSMEMKLTKI